MTEEASADENSSPPVLTAGELRAADFESPIRSSATVHCSKLAQLYREAADVSTDVAQQRCFSVLAGVTGIAFKPGDRAEPYGPMLVDGDRRSIIPDDLRGAQTEAFAEIAESTANPGLRARLADIAWLNDRRHVDMARVAIRAYVASVEAVLAGDAEFYFENEPAWSHNGAEIVRRACQIASTFRWQGGEAERLESTVGALFDAADAAGSGDGVERFGELLLDFGLGPSSKVAGTAERHAAVPSHPDTSRALWELAARAYGNQSNSAEKNRCLLAAAECYVTLAASAESKGMVAASWLMKAIEAMRRIPGTKQRRQEIEELLRDAQANISDEMGVISTELDLTDLVDQARQIISDLSLAAAFKEFAKLDGSPRPESLRQEALDRAREHPISHMFGTTVHDDEGKVVARSPGMMGDEADREAAIRHAIITQEGLRRQVTAMGLIEPARRVIVAEHPLTERHFRPLCQMSPFVPPAHEYLYSVGFARFFGGDRVSALSILVPQLENSLRYVLKQRSVDPSRIQDDLTQENRSLSLMLDKDREALVKAFGEAIVYEIENVFDVRGGPALRHGLAHGLLSDGEYQSADAIYACWFIFRLCCLPLFRHWQSVTTAYEKVV